MKNRIIYKLSFCLAMLSVVLSCDTDTTQQVTNLDTLVWSDEFDVAGAPDPSNWTYDLGDGSARGLVGWGNNELQFYTDRSENVRVENGNLIITARREMMGNSQYTSARILTRGLYQKKYGRFEARIKLPWGQGLWPAFWMLGDDNNGTEIWPQIGEIDIMENRGDQPTIVHGSVHGPGYSAGNAITKTYDLVDERLDTDFHIYGIEWGPNYINYYIDDVLYNQITPEDMPENGEWIFNDREFYMILNVAVGGVFSGNPTANTVFPQEMVVDYVRVYE